MRRVAPGKGRAEPVALDGSNQHDGRFTLVGRSLCVGGMELGEVVTADVGAKCLEVVVGEVGNESGEPVGVEQFLADGGTVGGHDALLIAIHQTVEAGGQQALRITSEKVVPRTAPEHLDDVPAGTSEAAFQFLDDLGISTDRTVEALQVAVHRHHDVVETFAAGEGELGERLGFIGLAVAHRVPNSGSRRRCETTVLKVAIESSLVDGRHGAKAHADGGELPEVGHQARMWVAGEALSADLLTEFFNVFMGQSTLKPSPGVNAR